MSFKNVVILVLFTSILLASAKDYVIEFRFPGESMHGRIHGRLLVIRDKLDKPIIGRIRSLRHDEQSYLVVKCGERPDKTEAQVSLMDGLGKMYFLPREQCIRGDESCTRSMVILVGPDGKRMMGVASKRTLGWGDKDNDIWGGYQFAIKAPLAK